MRDGTRLLGVLICAVLGTVACSGDADGAEPSDPPPTAEAPGTTLVPTTTVAIATTDPGPVTGSGPDLILHNANVITVDEGFTIASAVAIDDGVIVAVGTDIDITALAGDDTILVDLDGRSVMPGFVDPHVHALHNQTESMVAMATEQASLLSFGTTTVGTPAIISSNMTAFVAMNDVGLLLNRTHLYLQYNSSCGDPDPTDYWASLPFDRSADLKLAVAGVKVFADGGTCRAPAMGLDYLETTPDRLQADGWVGPGDLFADGAEIAAVVRRTDDAGGLTVIHAIGDRGVQAALDGIEGGLGGEVNTNRHRIDHNSFASLLSVDEVSRYGELGVRPVVFLVPFGDGCSAETQSVWKSIFERRAYEVVENFGSVLAANPGVEISWHSDAPNLVGDPLLHLFTAVTRGGVADDGSTCVPDGWDLTDAIPAPAALRMTTVNAAAAMDLDSAIGSLEVGKQADLIVLTGSPLDPDPVAAFLDNEVQVTFIDGEVMWCHPDQTRLCGSFPTEPRLVVTDPAAAVEGVGAGTDNAGTGTGTDGGVVAGIAASAEIEPAVRAIDGNLDAGWVSGSGPPGWIELDLGEVKEISGLRLRVDQSPAGFTRHRILGGPDSGPTAELAVIEGNTTRGDVLDVGDQNWSVRYLRIETVESPSWVAWLEIEVLLPT